MGINKFGCTGNGEFKLFSTRRKGKTLACTMEENVGET